MKKSDLKQGMLIQTTHNRYGFVEGSVRPVC